MASRPLALVSEQLDGATQRDEALGALVDPRQMPLQDRPVGGVLGRAAAAIGDLDQRANVAEAEVDRSRLADKTQPSNVLFRVEPTRR